MDDDSLDSDVSTLSSASSHSSDAVDVSEYRMKYVELEIVRPVFRQLQNVSDANRLSTSPMTKLAESMEHLCLDDDEADNQQYSTKSFKENTPTRSDSVLSREPRDTPLGQQAGPSSKKSISVYSEKKVVPFAAVDDKNRSMATCSKTPTRKFSLTSSIEVSKILASIPSTTVLDVISAEPSASDVNIDSATRVEKPSIGCMVLVPAETVLPGGENNDSTSRMQKINTDEIIVLGGEKSTDFSRDSTVEENKPSDIGFDTFYTSTEVEENSSKQRPSFTSATPIQLVPLNDANICVTSCPVEINISHTTDDDFILPHNFVDVIVKEPTEDDVNDYLLFPTQKIDIDSGNVATTSTELCHTQNLSAAFLEPAAVSRDIIHEEHVLLHDNGIDSTHDTQNITSNETAILKVEDSASQFEDILLDDLNESYSVSPDVIYRDDVASNDVNQETNSTYSLVSKNEKLKSSSIFIEATVVETDVQYPHADLLSFSQETIVKDFEKTTLTCTALIHAENVSADSSIDSSHDTQNITSNETTISKVDDSASQFEDILLDDLIEPHSASTDVFYRDDVAPNDVNRSSTLSTQETNSTCDVQNSAPRFEDDPRDGCTASHYLTLEFSSLLNTSNIFIESDDAISNDLNLSLSRASIAQELNLSSTAVGVVSMEATPLIQTEDVASDVDKIDSTYERRENEIMVVDAGKPCTGTASEDVTSSDDTNFESFSSRETLSSQTMFFDSEDTSLREDIQLDDVNSVVLDRTYMNTSDIIGDAENRIETVTSEAAKTETSSNKTNLTTNRSIVCDFVNLADSLTCDSISEYTASGNMMFESPFFSSERNSASSIIYDPEASTAASSDVISQYVPPNIDIVANTEMSPDNTLDPSTNSTAIKLKSFLLNSPTTPAEVKASEFFADDWLTFETSNYSLDASLATVAATPPTTEAYMHLRLRLCKTQQENARLKLMIAQYRATQLLTTSDHNPITVNDGIAKAATEARNRENDKTKEDYSTLKTLSKELLADFEKLVIMFSSVSNKFDKIQKSLGNVTRDHERRARSDQIMQPSCGPDCRNDLERQNLLPVLLSDVEEYKKSKME